MAAASIGKLLEIPKKTLRYIVSGHDTILKSTMESTDRETRTISSTETSSQSALSPSVGQNSRQVFLEYRKEIFGKPHKNTRTFAVDGFDFAVWTEASYSYTATKGICNARSCIVGVAHECRTKNPNAEQGRVLF